MERDKKTVHKMTIPTGIVSISQRTRRERITTDSNLDYYVDTSETDDIQCEAVPINLSIAATPEDWQKLEQALLDDPEGVLENLRQIARGATQRIESYGRPKGRPLTEVKLIERIKRDATDLYAFLSCFKDDAEKPRPILDLITLLGSKGYCVDKYSPRDIARAVLEIMYGKKAKDEILRPFKNLVNFKKTYIERSRYPKSYLRINYKKVSSLRSIFKTFRITL